MLTLLQFQQFVGGNPAYDIRKILRHAVISDSEDLDYAGIVEERIRLRAVKLELRRVLPERPHGKAPARSSDVARSSASSRQRFPISSQSISLVSAPQVDFCEAWAAVLTPQALVNQQNLLIPAQRQTAVWAERNGLFSAGAGASGIEDFGTEGFPAHTFRFRGIYNLPQLWRRSSAACALPSASPRGMFERQMTVKCWSGKRAM